MNEILRKRIEEATYEDADGLYPRYFAHHAVRMSGFFAGAEYALSHQWISVHEALPPYEEDVLIVDKPGEEGYGIYFNHRSNNPRVKTYQNGFCDLFGEAGEVLYWMPIPELKTKENGE